MSVFVDGHVHVDSPAVMFSVLEELAASKYRGRVSSGPALEGDEPYWTFEVHDSKDRLTEAVIGDHLILTYGLLVKVTDEEFTEGS